MLQKIKNLVIEEEGQALTEYGLIIGLIAVGVVAILATMGTEIKRLLTSISTSLTNAGK